MANKKNRDKVWKKRLKVPGLNPDVLRFDCYWNPIIKNHYGKKTMFSWEIDHKIPKSKGRSNKLGNLQPLQYKANRRKSNKLI